MTTCKFVLPLAALSMLLANVASAQQSYARAEAVYGQAFTDARAADLGRYEATGVARARATFYSSDRDVIVHTWSANAFAQRSGSQNVTRCFPREFNSHPLRQRGYLPTPWGDGNLDRLSLYGRFLPGARSVAVAEATAFAAGEAQRGVPGESPMSVKPELGPRREVPQREVPRREETEPTEAAPQTAAPAAAAPDNAAPQDAAPGDAIQRALDAAPAPSQSISVSVNHNGTSLALRSADGRHFRLDVGYATFEGQAKRSFRGPVNVIVEQLSELPKPLAQQARTLIEETLGPLPPAPAKVQPAAPKVQPAPEKAQPAAPVLKPATPLEGAAEPLTPAQPEAPSSNG